MHLTKSTFADNIVFEDCICRKPADFNQRVGCWRIIESRYSAKNIVRAVVSNIQIVAARIVKRSGGIVGIRVCIAEHCIAGPRIVKGKSSVEGVAAKTVVVGGAGLCD